MPPLFFLPSSLRSSLSPPPLSPLLPSPLFPLLYLFFSPPGPPPPGTSLFCTSAPPLALHYIVTT